MIQIEPGYYIMKAKTKGKKYSIFTKENGKYKYLLSFGALGYEQFKDSTPERLYKHLDHNDNNRRRLYYLRHGRTNNKLSAKYWANKYLW